MTYMLDTNMCVAVIRQKPRHVLERLTQQAPGTVCISVITAAELYHGAEKSAQPQQNRAALEQFFLPLIALDFDQHAAQVYGRVRAYLERQGTPIGSMDLLIASHALSANLTAVTHNTREFARVPQLSVEDWIALLSSKDTSI